MTYEQNLRAILDVHLPQIKDEIKDGIIESILRLETPDTFTSYMKKKYEEREDKDNIFGVGLSDAEFRTFVIDYLLGKNWHIADSISRSQVNEIALCEILDRYSKRYRKEKQCK